jgi:hypothetical protein
MTNLISFIQAAVGTFVIIHFVSRFFKKSEKEIEEELEEEFFEDLEELEKENEFITDRHVLLVDNKWAKSQSQEINARMEYIKNNFCGLVCDSLEALEKLHYDPLRQIFATGNINKYDIEDIQKAANVDSICVIEELSVVDCYLHTVSLDEVPLNIHNAGVFIKSFFASGCDYFALISKEHQFQCLTESNKPGTSYRKGIYITDVRKNVRRESEKSEKSEESEELSFNLLRCSTNFEGPTDNFRPTDLEIVEKVNELSTYFFKEKAELNHVLAQIYNNVVVENKEKKAKIKEHSDKTKDMPRNALMAFCTFYDRPVKDYRELTKLRFRLKKVEKYPQMTPEFDIVLSPNSVFLMSLQTNRLYTHEIIPSILPVDKLPVRMGYVIRCSNTEAVHRDGKTYIKKCSLNASIDNFDSNCYSLTPLRRSTPEEFSELKRLYSEENKSDKIVRYGPVDFSMNEGDYMKPKI